MSPRRAAHNALCLIIEQGRNLPDALEPQLEKISEAKDRALAQAITYGVMRQYFRLDAILTQLLPKPLRKKDHDVRITLLIGLYQLDFMRVPDHAAVAETVRLGKRLKKPWAGGLINGVLRNYQRQKNKFLTKLESNPVAQTAHPKWLLDLIQHDWPDHWRIITEANNAAPPMTLRVNSRHQDPAAYMTRLEAVNLKSTPGRHSKSALTLAEATDIRNLPDFAQGAVSVQDEAAQLTAPLLDPQPGERILDACAAPGGKTAQLLEHQPELMELVALDIAKNRLPRIDENLHRLKLQAHVVEGDAAQPDTWWDGEPFDRILLDAPCSASGVIRRHPDIKWLRQADDINELVKLQTQILVALWPLLKPGGILLYATCSILRQENTLQIEKFLASQHDAHLDRFDAAWGHAMPAGRQILPGEDGMDGFFYARLIKVNTP